MIKLIAAMSKNNVIGNGPDIPWHISEDLKRFKKLTTGCPIVMGRKTYDSIGRPLPNRENIVFSRSSKKIKGCSVRTSVPRLLSDFKDRDVWIIGGSEIYRMFIPYCEEMYITRVHEDFDGDVLFPVDAVDSAHWSIWEYFFTCDGKHTYSFEKHIKSEEEVFPTKRAFRPPIIHVEK
jgi:dihydrofolate reductase